MLTQRPIGQRTITPYASIVSPYDEAERRFDEAALNFRYAQLRLSDEAVQRGLNPQSFQRWLERKREPFYQALRKSVREARQQRPELSDKMTIEQAQGAVTCLEACTVAINRLARQLQSLKLPADFRGLMRVKTVDPQTLLCEYEKVLRKAQNFLREHDHFKAGELGRDNFFEMLDAFAEEDPRDRDLLENRRPAVFAEAVVARRYGIEPNTVHKRLIVARRAAGRPRLKSQLRPK
jgi:hypothetical protein